MAQLSLKITAEIEDPVWRWGRDLVSAIQGRARAEGVEVVFLFQAQNEGHFEATVADANAPPRIEPPADGSTEVLYWTFPGFRHRCRCGRYVRFHCRADCRGADLPVGVFTEEGAYRGDAEGDL